MIPSKTPIVGMLVAVSASWLACTFGGASIDEPALAARDWFATVATMDALKADELVCEIEREAFRDDMATGGALIGAFEWLVGPVEVEIDLTKVSFSTIGRRGDWAIVAAEGEMRAAVAGSVNSEKIHKRWFMTFEEGAWRWCGSTATEVQGASYGDSSSANAGTETSTFAGAPTPYELARMTISGLSSYRLVGTRQTSNADGTSSSYQFSGEQGRPRDAKWVFKDDQTGETTTILWSDQRNCSQRGGESWQCSELEQEAIRKGALMYSPDWIAQIIEGQPTRDDGEVISHGYREGTTAGQDCIIFFLAEVAQSEYTTVEITAEMCFDPDSYDLVMATVGSAYRSASGTFSLVDQVQFYDFSEPVEILMPSC